MLVFSFSVLLVFLSVVLYTNVPIFHELEERAEASNDRRFRSPTRNQTNHYTNCNPGETAFKGLASWLETGFRDGRVIERCFGRAYIGSSFTYCDSVFFFFCFVFYVLWFVDWVTSGPSRRILLNPPWPGRKQGTRYSRRGAMFDSDSKAGFLCSGYTVGSLGVSLSGNAS